MITSLVSEPHKTLEPPFPQNEDRAALHEAFSERLSGHYLGMWCGARPARRLVFCFRVDTPQDAIDAAYLSVQ